AAAGFALGAAEVVTATLLLIPASAFLGGLLAFAMLMAFSSFVAAALLRGESFDCGCLPGDSKPLSKSTLVRALLLALAAGIGAYGATEVAVVVDDPYFAGIYIACLGVGVWLMGSAFGRLHENRLLANDSVDWEWVVQQHGRNALEVDWS
ncbi:MAG: hypothetical protein QNL12_05785, partial [Acidimicrobiia bacterium]|nr:hypothetical protein [Acidimicrobiia bacterium]MDX2466805.1 hypothetical protein [Acidimicrobiia bacterium]